LTITLKNSTTLITCFLKKLTEDYPLILSSHNNWIIGITQRALGDYYLIFYYKIHSLFNKFIQIIKFSDFGIKFIPFDNFDNIREIGSGGYGTIYITKYKHLSNPSQLENVALKRYKRYYQSFELFVS